MEARVIVMSETLDRKVGAASAACGMTNAEFIRSCVQAGISSMGYRDHSLRVLFSFIDEQCGEARE